MAATLVEALEAFGVLTTYQAKYLKTVEKLTQDVDILLGFYHFPAEFCSMYRPPIRYGIGSHPSSATGKEFVQSVLGPSAKDVLRKYGFY